DILVVKLASDGSVMMVKTYGNAGADRLHCVAIDGDDNIFLGGWFDSMLDFGSGPLPRMGGADAFIAKLDPAGNHLWSRSAGANGPDGALDCASVGDSTAAAVHLTGYFSAGIDFGS